MSHAPLRQVRRLVVVDAEDARAALGSHSCCAAGVARPVRRRRWRRPRRAGRRGSRSSSGDAARRGSSPAARHRPRTIGRPTSPFVAVSGSIRRAARNSVPSVSSQPSSARPMAAPEIGELVEAMGAGKMQKIHAEHANPEGRRGLRGASRRLEGCHCIVAMPVPKMAIRRKPSTNRLTIASDTARPRLGGPVPALPVARSGRSSTRWATSVVAARCMTPRFIGSLPHG